MVAVSDKKNSAEIFCYTKLFQWIKLLCLCPYVTGIYDCKRKYRYLSKNKNQLFLHFTKLESNMEILYFISFNFKSWNMIATDTHYIPKSLLKCIAQIITKHAPFFILRKCLQQKSKPFFQLDNLYKNVQKY